MLYRNTIRHMKLISLDVLERLLKTILGKVRNESTAGRAQEADVAKSKIDHLI